MILLITYDISQDKARSKLHAFLKEYGLNTQKSVFECDVDEAGLKDIKSFAAGIIDPETDSVRIYRLCSRCVKKTEISGLGTKVTNMDFTVV